MSTGSIRDREIHSKEEFAEKGSVDTAKQWCEECRKILGLGVAGDAKRMEGAITGASKNIEKLHGIAAYGDGLVEKLAGFEKEFKEAAWELEILRGQYREFETLKKNAKWRSSEEKNAEKNMEKKEQEIKRAIEILESLDERSKKVVDDEKLRQKQVLSEIKAKPDGKEIAKTREAFGKELVKLKKVSEYYAKNYDTRTAGDIAGAFEALSTLNWLKINTLEEAQFELNQIKNTILAWQALQKEFVQGKSTFQSSQKQAQTLMQKAESILPTKLLTTGIPNALGFLERFSLGEQSALVRNWKVAGENVNPNFVAVLDKAIKDCEQTHIVWGKIKAKSYVDIKGLLEGLTSPQYKIVGMQKIADAVAIGDQDRDYVAAVNAFNEAEKEAKRIVAADAHFLIKESELTRERTRINILANSVTGEAQKFAVGYPDLIFAFRDRFKNECIAIPFNKNLVPTTGDIDEALDAIKLELSEIESKIKDLSDPGKVQQLTQELASKKDIKPFVLEMKTLADQASLKVLDYSGLRLDPVGDPQKIAAWNQKITGARTWIERREKDLETPESIVFDDVMKNHALLKTDLEKVIQEVTQAITDSAQAITLARTNLANELATLKKWLTGARLTTLREETWHAAANEEVQQIESLLKTDNKAAFEEKLARVLELQNQCKNVLKDSALNIVIPPESFLAYNALKDLFSELIKQVNSKETKKVLRTLSERYGGKSGVLVQTLAELRQDGPGSMPSKEAKWGERYRELKAEVEKNVLSVVKPVVEARKLCESKIKALRDRINGELCDAISKATAGKEVVLGANLPVMGKVNEAQGNMTVADSKERLDQVLKQLDNINEEVTWALEDVAGGDANRFVELNAQAEQAKREKHEINAQAKAQYELALKAFNDARSKAKSAPNVDQQEYKRYVDMYKQAEKSFKKGTFSEAAKKMDLACRLMRMLADNPIGSQVTGRGQEHLKELNIRWGSAIKTLNTSIGSLGNAILASCKQATDELNATQSESIQGKFEGKVVTPIESELDPAAFQRELLVLQGAAPSKSEEKAKDLANKKKYREQALAKVRNYQRLLQKHPMYQTVMFQSTPWRKDATVNALDLMRAINDIDLNVQRGVG